jgi:hypothetical protein
MNTETKGNEVNERGRPDAAPERVAPRLAVRELFDDPKEGKVKLNGENVIEFAKLPEMQQITLKVLRWEERDKRLVIKEAQIAA